MKKIKKIIGILPVTLTTAAVIPATALSDLPKANPITNNVVKTSTVTKTTNDDKPLVIDADVEEIEDSEYNNTDYTELSFASGSVCKTISRNAFANCKSLTKITLPASLSGSDATLGRGAFYGCTSLATIDATALTAAPTFDGISVFRRVSTTNAKLMVNKNLSSDVLDSILAAFRAAGLPSAWTLVDSDGNPIESVSKTLPTGFLKYTMNGSNITITGINSNICPASELAKYDKLVIPDQIDEKPVTTINGSAFANQTNWKTIDFTKTTSLYSTGSAAFENCTGITTVKLSTTITSIAQSSFSGCTSLTTVDVPTNSQLDGIYSLAFNGCSQLTTFAFANAPVKKIGAESFSGCGFTSLTFPATAFQDNEWVTGAGSAVGEKTFYNCTSLESVDLSACTQLKDIGTNAFGGCTALTSVKLPESQHDYLVKDNASTPATVELWHRPSSVKSNATLLKAGDSFTMNAITFKAGINDAGTSRILYVGRSWGSEGWTGDIKFTIPYVTRDTSPTITWSGSSTYVTVDSSTGVVTFSDISAAETTITATIGSTSTTCVVSPVIVKEAPTYFKFIASTTHENGAAIYNDGIGGTTDNLHIPDIWKLSSETNARYVTDIPNGNDTGGFGHEAEPCSDLKTLVIPSTVKTIGNKSFCYSEGLTSVTIQDGLNDFANECHFEGCKELTSIVLPNSIDTIYGNWFGNITEEGEWGTIPGVTIDLTALDHVPTLSNPFITIPNEELLEIKSGFKIKVKQSLVDDFKAATNWSKYTDYINYQ